MWGFYIWLLSLPTVAFSNARIFREGNLCMLQNGDIGTCKKLLSCSQALRDLFRVNIFLSKCDPYFGLICCDDSSASMNWVDSSLMGNRAYWTNPNLDELGWNSQFDEAKPGWSDPNQAGSSQGWAFATTKRLKKKNGRKSKEKCEEYSKWQDSRNKKFRRKCNTVESKIIGGKRASPSEFPHMAKLGYGNISEPSFECGATLISEQYLLTAAHCLKGSRGPFVAGLGGGRRRPQIIINIAKIIPHPDWIEEEREDHELYHDIALLLLERPISKFEGSIRPACLQTESRISERTAIATGWGVKIDGQQSRHLRKVTLPLLDHSNCDAIYEKQEKISRGLDESSMICAGETDRNTCQGDSGGPLQIKKKCVYRIIGVTSFGRDGCASQGIYTRVSYYTPWIESVVWPNED